ncbi:MAG TPA: ABC transporter ATP-binding protein [Polyangia bacterium]|jgi:ABC-2 type transport system ATP-binding protein
MPPEPAAAPAITVEGLVKVYGDRRVVDGLGFTVAAGETFALLGPNGAGKTTTVEILEGYRRADGGTVAVLGLDPARDGATLKPRVGVMLQESQLYRSIRVREALALFARFHAAPAGIDELLAQVGLRDAAGLPFRALSGGQRKRLALALSLVGRPDLLFLDEPTAGMDPHGRRDTWELLRGLKRAGTAIMLTTQHLEEAEELCDRVAIIDHGRLLCLGRPGEITRGGAPAVRFRARPGLDCARLAALPAAQGAVEEQPGSYVLAAADAPQLLVELTTYLRDAGVALEELAVGRESLEQVFLRLTEGRAAGEPRRSSEAS